MLQAHGPGMLSGGFPGGGLAWPQGTRSSRRVSGRGLSCRCGFWGALMKEASQGMGSKDEDVAGVFPSISRWFSASCLSLREFEDQQCGVRGDTSTQGLPRTTKFKVRRVLLTLSTRTSASQDALRSTKRRELLDLLYRVSKDKKIFRSGN